MRTFIAMEIPENSLESVRIIQQRMKDRIQSRVSWVKPDHMHITLKFIGNMDTNKQDDLKIQISEECKTIRPLEISIKGLGCFPSFRSPRVLWMGIVADKALKTLAEKIETACVNTGIPAEVRIFSPHLTLGRVKSSLSSTEIELIKSMFEYHKEEQFTQWLGSEIVLFQSKLEPSGPIYTPLEKFNLQK